MNESSVDGRAPMRHVPPVEYLIFKIDVDYRSRVEVLLRAFEENAERLSPEEKHALAAEFASLARGIERFAEILRGSRTHHPDELRGRMDAALANATHALLATPPETFRLRAPLNEFEKSLGEYALGAFLVIVAQIRRISETVGEVVPGVWEELLSGSVPADRPAQLVEALEPIA